MFLFCKTCRGFSKLRDVKNNKKGVARIGTETFVKGTSVIRKNNFTDHVQRSKTHVSAVIRLSEKEAQKESDGCSFPSTWTGAPNRPR